MKHSKSGGFMENAVNEQRIDVKEEKGTMAPTDEWTTAALAHGSILLTFILAFAGGVGALAGLAVALAIYLGYRERSQFVALHALQALIYQVAGILAYILLAAGLALCVIVAWVVIGVLSAVLIGLLLIPFALPATLLIFLLLLAAPLAWLGYGLYAAYQVYQGHHVRYWLIGQWVEEELI